MNNTLPSLCRLWSWSFGVRPGMFISSGFSEESDATHPHTDLGNCWPRDCISEQQLGLLASLLRQTCQEVRADWTDHGIKITLWGEWWWFVSSLGPVFLINNVSFLKSGCNRFWQESFSFIVEITNVDLGTLSLSQWALNVKGTRLHGQSDDQLHRTSPYGSLVCSVSVSLSIHNAACQLHATSHCVPQWSLQVAYFLSHRVQSLFLRNNDSIIKKLILPVSFSQDGWKIAIAHKLQIHHPVGHLSKL